MKYHTYYYASVSSPEQDLESQLEAFRADGAHEQDVITDNYCGKDLKRPGYFALKTSLLHSGDILTIYSLDRLSGRKSHIISELQWFKEHNIRLRILDIPTTLLTAPRDQEWLLRIITNLLIEVLTSFLKSEQKTTHIRQATGIEAKLNNPDRKSYGRPAVKKPDNWDCVMQQWRNGEITAVCAMKLTGLKKTTFYKLVKENAQ